MVPTFLFIFSVYAIFALLTAWRQRSMRLHRSAKREPGPRWGALLMPFGVALLVASAVPCLNHFNLAEVLNEEERDGLEEQVLTYTAGFPIRVHATDVPPIYSLLHPQMTISTFPSEKKTSVIFLRKPHRKVALRMSDKKVRLNYSMAMKMPGRR